MKPQLGVLGVLKTTTHIVFSNFHHLLRVSALPVLLFYVFKALFPAAPSSIRASTLRCIIVLSDDLIVLIFSRKTTRDLLVLRSHPPLYPNLHSWRDVISNLFFVLFSVMLANQLNAVYTIAATICVCRNFAISAMLAVIAGAVYTVLTMCSLDKCSPIDVEESRRWVDYLIMWCIDVVQTSKWVAAVACICAFSFALVLESSLSAWIQAKADVLSVMWRCVAAGVSVSLLPLLFLWVLSTHAALYLSCRTHHISDSSSADSLIAHISDSVDEEPTS